MMFLKSTLVFYHGTSKEKSEQILRLGLDPQQSQSSHNEVADNYDDHVYESNDRPDLTQFVYLARSRHTAQEYADHHRGNVILKIKVSKRFASQFIYDRGEFIRSPVVIPPNYIKVDNSFY